MATLRVRGAYPPLSLSGLSHLRPITPSLIPSHSRSAATSTSTSTSTDSSKSTSKSSSSSSSTSKSNSHTSIHSSILDKPTPELDPSYAPLLNHMHMASRRHRTNSDTDHDSLETSATLTHTTRSETGSRGGATLETSVGLDQGGLYSAEAQESERLGSGSGSGRLGEKMGLGGEESKSPAAILGSKRIGTVVIPTILSESIQTQIHQSNPRDIRAAFLTHRASLPQTPTASQLHLQSQPADRNRERRGSSRATPELSLAKAAAYMSSEYAAVKNVIEELDKRLGQGWAGDRVLEVSGGYGVGCWALVGDEEGTGKIEDGNEVEPNVKVEIESETQDKRREYILVHKTRHGLDLAQKLIQTSPSLQHATLKRDLSQVVSDKPASLVMSTFHLSTLPTSAGRQTHLRHLLSFSPSFIILVDRATPAGWTAMSEARTFLLSQSTPEAPLHTVAPCPHDGVCPLASLEGGKEPCAFSQRLQRPEFVRRTKHSNRGDEDMRYTYLVVAKGDRPALENLEGLNSEGMSELGRMGRVGKEEMERIKAKNAGLNELRELEGGDFEIIQMPKEARQEELRVERNVVESETLGNVVEGFVGEEDLIQRLRTEAYSWPRLVAPPMKRSGHVVMDACCPSGDIKRLTFARSHSKQGYYDARKSSWGDLFPHSIKGKTPVRTRGVRRLVKVQSMSDGGENVEAMLKRLGVEGSKVVAEIEEVVEGGSDEGEWVRSSGDGRVTVRHSTLGQTRGMVTMSTGRDSIKPTRLTLSSLTSSTRPRPKTLMGVGILHGTVPRRWMSARPSERPSTSLHRPKVTLAELRRMAASNEPITVLTAYDYPTALLSQASGIDMVLVGDSLSQVALGHSSTTSITLDEMIHHAKAVTRGAKSPFVLVDMPFGSFEISIEQGVASVIRLIKESGADGIKIEGGKEIVPLVKKLSEKGIAVVPHLGLQPQRATALSGYLVQARTSEGAIELLETAREMDKAGAVGLLIEAVPHSIASKITELIKCESKSGLFTIGIGAGPGTDGQVLVVTDVLGTYVGLEGETEGECESEGRDAPQRPRFVRQFGEMGKENRKAVNGFIEQVKKRSFPMTGKETYGIKKEELERFLEYIDRGEVSVKNDVVGRGSREGNGKLEETQDVQ